MDYKLETTVYGKYSKYEVFRKTGSILGGTAGFTVSKKSKHWKSFSSLRDAVEAAQDAADREG